LQFQIANLQIQFLDLQIPHFHLQFQNVSAVSGLQFQQALLKNILLVLIAL